MEDLLNFTDSISVPLDTLLVNLLLCLFLTIFLAWFYTRYGETFSNRSKLASTLPVLALTVLLVISVVKSSLALSLGLVGALSIVRFRTAIKEPEELIYIFIAIAVGIGLGADQRLVTLAAFVVIMAYLFIHTTVSPRRQKSNLFLNITTPDRDAGFKEINAVLLAHTSTANLRRLDHLEDGLHATYLIDCSNDSSLSHLMDALKSNIPGSEFSFVEQDNTLGG